MHDIIAQYLGDALSAALLAAIGLIVRLALAEWRNLRPKIEEAYQRRVDAATRALLAQVGREAFVFAEAMYKQLAGPERLQYAMEYAVKRLHQAGVHVTTSEIYAAIHDAWLADKRQQEQQKSTS